MVLSVALVDAMIKDADIVAVRDGSSPTIVPYTELTIPSTIYISA